jgi:hypothetical protein
MAWSFLLSMYSSSSQREKGAHVHEDEAHRLSLGVHGRKDRCRCVCIGVHAPFSMALDGWRQWHGVVASCHTSTQYICDQLFIYDQIAKYKCNS